MRDTWIGSGADGVTSRLRKRGYDYTNPGDYFVTVVAAARLPIFGHIKSGAAVASALGEMVIEEWDALENTCQGIMLDAYQLMPDHFHGIITILRSDNSLSLSAIMGRFKSITARRYRDLCSAGITPDIGRTCWQSKFYDTIIRNEQHYDEVINYMALNPHRWTQELSR